MFKNFNSKDLVVLGAGLVIFGAGYVAGASRTAVIAKRAFVEAANELIQDLQEQQAASKIDDANN